ncbi:MAG: dTDP-4-dehydrorhamnose 3,5-epimerase, partial [Sphingobacteriales bacterium]
MQVIKTSIEGLVELRPKTFKDARGSFLETY